MSKAFSNFRGSSAAPNTKHIWQSHDSLFPFRCDICGKTFEQGGKRFLASSLVIHSHRAAACHCEDCHNGVNPFRIKTPKLTDRRTTLD